LVLEPAVAASLPELRKRLFQFGIITTKMQSLDGFVAINIQYVHNNDAIL
jgi:hypothetical protein